MTEQASPVEQALDLLLYAPLGLLLTVRDEFPKLVEKGRQQIAGQILVARMAGEFALGQAQKELDRRVEQATARLRELQQGGRLAAGPPTPSSAPVPEATRDRDAGPDGPTAGTHDAPEPPPPWTPVPEPPAGPRSRPAGPAGLDGAEGDGAGVGLAIPGYDLLSASQVVQRLAGLSPGELEEVRAHEAGHRGRKTILSRIHQLQAGS